MAIVQKKRFMKNELPFPKGAKLLCVQAEMESGVMIPFIYYLAGEGTEEVDTRDEEMRYFEVRYTGQQVSEIAKAEKYIGSYDLPGYSHSYHAFELREEPLTPLSLTVLPTAKRTMKPEMLVAALALATSVAAFIMIMLSLP